MSHHGNDSDFEDEVKFLRETYTARRMASTLYSPAGQNMDDFLEDHSEPYVVYHYWYANTGRGQRYVRLYDIPGTLSGDIIRLRQNLPKDPFHVEVKGDDINVVDTVPKPPEELLPDDEDCSAALELLPLVPVDPDKHFTKRPVYINEVYNHLRLREGAISLTGGAQLSDFVVPLLGKNTKNELVFPKAIPALHVVHQIQRLATYKRWILELVRAVHYLHSQDIVHQDLRLANFVFFSTSDERVDGGDGAHLRLVLCDLESHWGIRFAPELDKTLDSKGGWTKKSDVYDIAGCIRGMIYANNPINPIVGAEWIVPAPLDEICDACTVADPARRPTIEELEQLVEAIPTN